MLLAARDCKLGTLHRRSLCFARPAHQRTTQLEAGHDQAITTSKSHAQEVAKLQVGRLQSTTACCCAHPDGLSAGNPNAHAALLCSPRLRWTAPLLSLRRCGSSWRQWRASAPQPPSAAAASWRSGSSATQPGTRRWPRSGACGHVRRQCSVACTSLHVWPPCLRAIMTTHRSTVTELLAAGNAARTEADQARQQLKASGTEVERLTVSLAGEGGSAWRGCAGKVSARALHAGCGACAHRVPPCR